MKNRLTWISAVLLTAALVLALVAPALAAATAAGTSAPASTVSYPTATMSRLLEPALPIAAFTVTTTAPAQAAAPAAHRVATRPAAKAPARKAAAKTASVRRTSTSGTRPASSSSSSSSASKVSDLSTAESVLASLKATYKYLSGVTVEIGTTPGGYQAVSYYTSGRIVISSKHTVSIRTILKHEIWHIIDWRDNGHIDWGENIPPANAASYRL